MTFDLFITNIPDELNNDELKELFNEYGEVQDVRIVKKGRAKSHYGFVAYDNDQSRDDAIANINDVLIGEIQLTVEKTREKPDKKKKTPVHKNREKAPKAAKLAEPVIKTGAYWE